MLYAFMFSCINNLTRSYQLRQPTATLTTPTVLELLAQLLTATWALLEATLTLTPAAPLLTQFPTAICQVRLLTFPLPRRLTATWQLWLLKHRLDLLRLLHPQVNFVGYNRLIFSLSKMRLTDIFSLS